MIDEFDYAEPACPLCDGKDFYYPKKEGPLGRIPVARILDRVDALFAKNDTAEAGRLLTYWKDEAVALRDAGGELTMQSELVGFFRKQGQKEAALAAADRALALMEQLDQGEMASGATVLINCATAYKAFDMAAQALPLYRRAEQVYLRVLPQGDERFGGLYNNMALALADVGRFGEAEEAYGKALSIMEAIPGGQADRAITYINLAHLYEAWDRPARIGDCMAKAKELLASDALPHDGYYAFVLDKCAPSFGYFGDTATYERMKKEAEDIYAGA